MGNVSYISSAGICVLISAYKKAVKGNKKLLIGEMSPKVQEILGVMGVLPLFSGVIGRE